MKLWTFLVVSFALITGACNGKETRTAELPDDGIDANPDGFEFSEDDAIRTELDNGTNIMVWQYDPVEKLIAYSQNLKDGYPKEAASDATFASTKLASKADNDVSEDSQSRISENQDEEVKNEATKPKQTDAKTFENSASLTLDESESAKAEFSAASFTLDENEHLALMKALMATTEGLDQCSEASADFKYYVFSGKTRCRNKALYNSVAKILQDQLSESEAKKDVLAAKKANQSDKELDDDDSDK